MQVHKTLPSMKINMNTNKSVTFSGGEIVKYANKLFEPNRMGNMSRSLFLWNCYIFLLGGRFFRSREDEKKEKTSINNEKEKPLFSNEKRETLIRDVPTILAAAYGVPYFEKFVSIWN